MDLPDWLWFFYYLKLEQSCGHYLTLGEENWKSFDFAFERVLITLFDNGVVGDFTASFGAFILSNTGAIDNFSAEEFKDSNSFLLSAGFFFFFFGGLYEKNTLSKILYKLNKLEFLRVTNIKNCLKNNVKSLYVSGFY